MTSAQFQLLQSLEAEYGKNRGTPYVTVQYCQDLVVLVLSMLCVLQVADEVVRLVSRVVSISLLCYVAI